VQQGLQLQQDNVRKGPMDEKTKEVLFGATQYEKR
jgi:hypothetical protein